MELQPSRMLRAELQARGLEPKQKLRRIHQGDGDENRVAGLEGRPIGFPEQAIPRHLEAQELLGERVLVVDPYLAALTHLLGPERLLRTLSAARRP